MTSRTYAADDADTIAAKLRELERERAEALNRVCEHVWDAFTCVKCGKGFAAHAAEKEAGLTGLRVPAQMPPDAVTLCWGADCPGDITVTPPLAIGTGRLVPVGECRCWLKVYGEPDDSDAWGALR